MSGIQYPVDIKDIGEFEHQNNISVNVYGCEDKNIFSLRITITNTGIHHENLLYVTVGKTSHYVLVKDLGRLLLRQYNNDNSKRCFCQYCLHDCTSEVVLKNHFGRCKLHGAQSPKLPEADNKEGHENVKFTKTDYQLHLPFVICVDFESAARTQDSCEPSSSKSFTTQYQQHIPSRRCIYVKCSDGQYFEPPQVNIRIETAKKSLNQVLAAGPMKRVTQEQWREYNNVTNCSMCAKPFKLIECNYGQYQDYNVGGACL